MSPEERASAVLRAFEFEVIQQNNRELSLIDADPSKESREDTIARLSAVDVSAHADGREANDVIVYVVPTAGLPGLISVPLRTLLIEGIKEEGLTEQGMMVIAAALHAIGRDIEQRALYGEGTSPSVRVGA
jgi:hypothetical protein